MLALTTLIAVSVAAQSEALVVDDPAGDSLVPSGSYDLRRLTVSGTGAELRVAITAEAIPSVGPVPTYILLFDSPSALPGHEHSLQCAHHPVVCMLTVWTADSHPAPNVHIGDTETTEVAAEIIQEEASIVAAIPYGAFHATGADALTGFYLATYMCLDSFCLPGDRMDAQDATYVLP